VLGRTPRWTRAALAAVLLAVVPLSVAGTAEAATSDCTPRNLKKSFAAWGDQNDYFLVPDGSFESGTPSWTTSWGVTPLLGSHGFTTLGTANARSLYLPYGGTATTPTMCVAANEDSLRFLYKNPGVPGAQLHVSIRVTSGVNVATNDLDITSSGFGWGASPRIMLPDIRDASGRQYVTVTFSTRGTPAAWRIDEVQVDPWRSL
jgi:hypothetical protein